MACWRSFAASHLVALLSRGPMLRRRMRSQLPRRAKFSRPRPMPGRGFPRPWWRHWRLHPGHSRLTYLPAVRISGRPPGTWSPGCRGGTSTDQPLPHFLPSDSFHVSHFRITPATFQILEKKYFCSCSKMELTDRCGGGEIVLEDQLQYSGAGEMGM